MQRTIAWNIHGHFFTSVYPNQIFLILTPSIKHLTQYQTPSIDSITLLYPFHLAPTPLKFLTCQKYFQSFIATKIFSQHLFRILQNIPSQHYNLNFLKYF